MTVSVGEVGLSVPGRKGGEGRARKQSEGRASLSQLWSFRYAILTTLWKVDYRKTRFWRDPRLEAVFRSLDFILDQKGTWSCLPSQEVSWGIVAGGPED